MRCRYYFQQRTTMLRCRFSLTLHVCNTNEYFVADFLKSAMQYFGVLQICKISAENPQHTITFVADYKIFGFMQRKVRCVADMPLYPVEISLFPPCSSLEFSQRFPNYSN